MLDLGFAVRNTPSALRDLDQQMIWLENNRSESYADRFLQAFKQLKVTLSKQPFRWQKVVVRGRTVRRAVLMKNWVVLYAIFPDDEVVMIYSIRGAAEDWTNQPISD